MKLNDFIENMEDIDQEAIIFQEDIENAFSDIIISYPEEEDHGVKEVDGKKYFYLIEVFLATEFIEDWVASLNHKPSVEDIVKRLHEYALNDA